MHQIAAAVWNAIARTQELRSPSFKALMAMPQNELAQALASQATALEQNGTPDSVINAYQQMAPLLVENEAISAYINHVENLDLRAALPEILSANEAVLIASNDHFLNAEEQQTLLIMLRRLE